MVCLCGEGSSLQTWINVIFTLSALTEHLSGHPIGAERRSEEIGEENIYIYFCIFANTLSVLRKYCGRSLDIWQVPGRRQQKRGHSRWFPLWRWKSYQSSPLSVESEVQSPSVHSCPVSSPKTAGCSPLLSQKSTPFFLSPLRTNHLEARRVYLVSFDSWPLSADRMLSPRLMQRCHFRLHYKTGRSSRPEQRKPIGRRTMATVRCL